jgi:EF-P beta-lysylation protein EpmB
MPFHATGTHGASVGKRDMVSAAIKGTGIPAVQRRVTDVGGLLGFLELDVRSAPYRVMESPEFPLMVPLSFAARMRKRDWYDPLLLQVLPRAEEAAEREGFSADAVGDAAAAAAPGVLHKYDSRVLLMAGSDCAIRCRFCFRRHCSVRPVSFRPGTTDRLSRHLARHPAVNEVILSGGDPLCLDAGSFEELTERVVAEPQVRTVRIHTRVPVADPGMLTQKMLEAIASVARVKSCVVVIHADHAGELAADCSRALMRLRTTGAVLLNQSVLLKGINDSVEALCGLSGALLDHGVVPYYLHQLDRVRGAWHFEVDEETGKKLIKGMREKLPGYAVPRYVREVAGERAKQPLL